MGVFPRIFFAICAAFVAGASFHSVQGLERQGEGADVCTQFPWDDMRAAVPSSLFGGDVGVDAYADDSYARAAHAAAGGARGLIGPNQAYASLFGMDAGVRGVRGVRGIRGAEGLEGAEGASLAALLRPAIFEDERLSRIAEAASPYSDAYFPNVEVERRDGTRVQIKNVLVDTAESDAQRTTGQETHVFADPRAIFTRVPREPRGADAADAADVIYAPAATHVSVSAVKGSCAVRCDRAVGKKSCMERCECQQLCADAKEQDRCHRRCLQERRAAPGSVREDDGTQGVDKVGFAQRYRCYACLSDCVEKAATASSAYSCQVSTCAGQCDRESIPWDTTSGCRTACLNDKKDYIGCVTRCGDI